MDTRAFIKQEVIDGGTLDVMNIVCPGCGKNTLVLSGQATIPQKEIMENGEITDRLPGLYEDGAFDLQQIDCMSCNTQYLIKDHRLFILEKEVEALRKWVEQHKGKQPKEEHTN